MVPPHPLCMPPAQHLAHWVAITVLAEEMFQSKGDQLMQHGVRDWILGWDKNIALKDSIGTTGGI